MKMINELNDKITEQFGLDFDELLEDFLEDSYDNHRRGSSFYKQSIVEISEKNYPHIDNELYGFWETNEYIFDTEYGYDKRDIHTLNRVVQKEKTIVKTYWERI